MNINGYMKKTETGLQSSLGDKVNSGKGFVLARKKAVFLTHVSEYEIKP